MKINRCPNCGGRLVADILESDVMVRCNACGQELGTFDRADKPVIISDNELSPLATERELKDCPFCGSAAVLEEVDTDEFAPYDETWYQVLCESCCGSSGTYLTPEAAIDAWNTRD